MEDADYAAEVDPQMPAPPRPGERPVLQPNDMDPPQEENRSRNKAAKAALWA